MILTVLTLLKVCMIYICLFYLLFIYLFIFLDLDDNLHGSELLQQPQESINRVTGNS